MDVLTKPDLEMLRDWMDQRNIEWFECGECQSLHLTAMQDINGAYDAKLDIVDDVILVTLSADIRPSALLGMVGELSQINASTLTVKAFLDIQDDNTSKLILCQSLSIGCGLTSSQFGFFMQQSEEQLTMLVMELAAGHLLVNGDIETPVADNTPLLH